jgi:tetratricopeptide (TPR) repeat protein
LIGSGDPDAALAAIDRAIAIYEAGSPGGPNLSLALSNRSTVLLTRGDLAPACETATRALAIAERWYGTSHAALTYPLNSLGTCHLQAGRSDQAVPLLERSLELSRVELGEESWGYATALANVGGVYAQLARYDESVATTSRALAILERLRGVDNASLPTGLEILAYAQRHAGQLADSERSLRRAIEITERTYGRMHPASANAYNELGLTLLANRNPAAARLAFEHSVAIADAHPLSPIIAAEARLELAKLLVADPATRDRARTLAAAALDAYRKLGEGYGLRVAQAERLLQAP